MKTRTWVILLGALALAGLADVATLAGTPVWMRSYDVSPVVRAFPDCLAALLVAKAAILVGTLVVIPLARYSGLWVERALAFLPVGISAVYLYGAWTNVAYGWR